MPPLKLTEICFGKARNRLHEKCKKFLLQTRPARNCKGYVGRKKEKRVRERSDYLKRKTPFFNNHLAVLNPFMYNFLCRLQIVHNNSKIMTY